MLCFRTEILLNELTAYIKYGKISVHMDEPKITISSELSVGTESNPYFHFNCDTI